MWFYQDKEITEIPSDIAGFVYCITELSTGKRYIGKKLAWKTVTRSVNKKRKKVKVSSDWMSYYGSSKALQESVSVHGDSNYRRDILRLCKSKGEMSYYELKEQMDRRVLFDDGYYNEFMGCRLHSKHVKDLKNEEL